MIIQKKTQFVRLSALTLVVLGVIYIGLIVWGIITQDPETGFIRDHVRILMEIVTMLSAIALLFLAISIKYLLHPDHNFLAEIGVLFMILLVTLTSIVHFVSITVSSQIVSSNPSLAPLFSLEWPSLLLSIDILAWDIFFGFGFIFLGLSLRKLKSLSMVSLFMILSGILSIFGLIALPLNNMDIRFIGIFGYTVLPVISSVILLFKIGKLE